MLSFSRDIAKGKVLAGNYVLTLLLLIIVLLSTLMVTTVECHSATNEYYSNNYRLANNNTSNELQYKNMLNQHFVLQHHCIHGDQLFQEKLFSNVYAAHQQKLTLSFTDNSHNTITTSSGSNINNNNSSISSVDYEHYQNVKNIFDVYNELQVNRTLTNSSLIRTTTSSPPVQEEYNVYKEYFRRYEEETRIFAPIRIRFDTSHLYESSYVCTEANQIRPDFLGGNVTCTSSDIMTESMRDMLTQLIIPRLIHRTQRLIDVRRLTHPLRVPVEACGRDVHIPHSHRASNNSNFSYNNKKNYYKRYADGHTANGGNGDGNGVPETDLLIYALAAPMSDRKSNTNTIAWSSYCVLDESDNGRPIVARINFVPYHIHHYLRQRETRYGAIALVWMHDVNALVYEGDAEDEWMEQYMRFVLHEMCHALGFTPLFLNTLSQMWRRSGKEVRSVNSTRVVQTAEHFFRCYSANSTLALHGVDLEDEGEEGTVLAHWERREFHDELMVGVPSSNNAALSSLTLSFFASLPFYKVHMEYAQPMKWGKHAGCLFLESNCTNFASQHANQTNINITRGIEQNNANMTFWEGNDDKINNKVTRQTKSNNNNKSVKSNFSVNELTKLSSTSSERLEEEEEELQSQLTSQKYWCTESAALAYPQLQCTYDRRSVGICNVEFNSQDTSHHTSVNTESKSETNQSNALFKSYTLLKSSFFSVNKVNARGRSLLMDGCPIVEPISSMMCTKVLASSIRLPFNSISARSFYFGPQSRCVRTNKLTEHLHFNTNQGSGSNADASDMSFIRRVAHVVENKWNEFKDYVLSFVYDSDAYTTSDLTSVQNLLLSSANVQPIVELDGASCLRVRCRHGVQVEIQVGTFWFACPANGSAGVIQLPSWSGYSGEVYCEHYSLICTSEVFVERNVLHDDASNYYNNNNNNNIAQRWQRWKNGENVKEEIVPSKEESQFEQRNNAEHANHNRTHTTWRQWWRRDTSYSENDSTNDVNYNDDKKEDRLQKANCSDVTNDKEECISEKFIAMQAVYPLREYRVIIGLHIGLAQSTQTEQESNLNSHDHNLDKEVNAHDCKGKENEEIVHTEVELLKEILTSQQGKLQAALEDDVSSAISVKLDTHVQNKSVIKVRSLPYFAAAVISASNDKVKVSEMTKKPLYYYSSKLHEITSAATAAIRTSNDKHHFQFPRLSHKKIEVKQKYCGVNNNVNKNAVSFIGVTLSLAISSHNETELASLVSMFTSMLHQGLPLEHLTQVITEYDNNNNPESLLPYLTAAPFLISYNVIDKEYNTVDHNKTISNSTPTIITPTSFLVSEASASIDESSAFDDTSHWVDLAALSDIQLTLQITHHLHRTLQYQEREEWEENNNYDHNFHSVNNVDGNSEITNNKDRKSIKQTNNENCNKNNNSKSNNQCNYTNSNDSNHKRNSTMNKTANSSESVTAVSLWKELQSTDRRNVLALSIREDLAKVLGLTHNLVAITSVDLSAHYMANGEVNDNEEQSVNRINDAKHANLSVDTDKFNSSISMNKNKRKYYHDNMTSNNNKNVNNRHTKNNNNNNTIISDNAEDVIVNEVIEINVNGTIYLSPLMVESGVNHTLELHAQEYTLQKWEEWLQSCTNHTAEWDATTCHLVELCTGTPLGAPVVLASSSSSSSLFSLAKQNNRRSAINVKIINFTLANAQPHAMLTKTMDNMHVHDSRSIFSYYRHHRSLRKYCFATSRTAASTRKGHAICIHLMDVLLFLTAVTLVMFFTFLVKSKYIRFTSRKGGP